MRVGRCAVVQVCGSGSLWNPRAGCTTTARKKNPRCRAILLLAWSRWRPLRLLDTAPGSAGHTPHHDYHPTHDPPQHCAHVSRPALHLTRVRALHKPAAQIARAAGAPDVDSHPRSTRSPSSTAATASATPSPRPLPLATPPTASTSARSTTARFRTILFEGRLVLFEPDARLPAACPPTSLATGTDHSRPHTIAHPRKRRRAVLELLARATGRPIERLPARAPAAH